MLFKALQLGLDVKPIMHTLWFICNTHYRSLDVWLLSRTFLSHLLSGSSPLSYSTFLPIFLTHHTSSAMSLQVMH